MILYSGIYPGYETTIGIGEPMGTRQIHREESGNSTFGCVFFSAMTGSLRRMRSAGPSGGKEDPEKTAGATEFFWGKP